MEVLRRVADPDELQPEDVIIVRGCRGCGGSHGHLLLQLTPQGWWLTVGKYHKENSNTLVVDPAIREGRLFKVAKGGGQETRVLEDIRAALTVAPLALTAQLRKGTWLWP